MRKYILYDCMESYVEEGVIEVCIVANEVRSLSPLLERDVIGLGQLGLTLRFQQLAPSIQRSLESWDVSAKHFSGGQRTLPRPAISQIASSRPARSA